MNELMEKIDDLLIALDDCSVIQELKQKKECVMKDEELLHKVFEYQNKPTLSLKEEIFKNKNFQEYKHYEAECNLLIMEINHRLKEIHHKGKCGL